MFVFTSNSLKYLALTLTQEIRLPAEDPLAEELILVQSQGMQRWISMQLALEFGVAANIAFPFPASFVHTLYAKLFPDASTNLLNKDTLSWLILQKLPILLEDEDFAPLRPYAPADDPLKALQLAEKIAFHLDQYLLFRPDWFARWENAQPAEIFSGYAAKTTERWQGKLWRMLQKEHENAHRLSLFHKIIWELEHTDCAHLLPPRLSLFGIPTLPPVYLSLFEALNQHIPVSFYLLSPCSKYWADLSKNSLDEGSTHLPLASMGRMGRDFQHILLENHQDLLPLYRKHPAPQTMLEILQERMLELKEHEIFGPSELLAESTEQLRDSTACKDHLGDDTSIRVHCCHGPLREMEVLREELLEIFATCPDIEPQDVLVITPDMEQYAPYIQAVFGFPEDPGQYIPFSLADRSVTKSDEYFRFLLELLESALHHFEASRVYALLEAAPLRYKFRLSEAHLDTIHNWLTQAGIRRGFTAHSTQGAAGNTWEHGLTRLFLGSMFPPAVPPVQGIGPKFYGDASDLELLGILTHILEELGTLWTSLQIKKTMTDWCDTLQDILEQFFPDDINSVESLLPLRMVLLSLRDQAKQCSELLDVRCVQHLLRTRLDEKIPEHGFLAAGITFCGPRPMRAIPFRILCLCGMSATAFPRQDTPTGLDLLKESPRPGDRSLRQDDRYLFLESLLSASDKILLTYPGLSESDTTKIPPSPLISELLDSLDAFFTLDGEKPSKTCVLYHPLHAFSPEYFTGQTALFSRSACQLQNAQTLRTPEKHLVFFSHESSGSWPAELSLDELVRFFQHPVKATCRSLGLVFGAHQNILQDEEPTSKPDYLELYHLKNALLPTIIETASFPLESCMTAEQIFPTGILGETLCAKEARALRSLAEKVRSRYCSEPTVEHIQLTLQETCLHGTISLWENTLLSIRPASSRIRDFMTLWIPLLAARAAHLDIHALHIGQDGTCLLPTPTPTRSRELLNVLLEYYVQGQNAPIPFFPKTLNTYIEVRYASSFSEEHKGMQKPQEEALQKAQNTWTGTSYLPGERDQDAYFSFVYRDQSPDWTEFVLLAENICAPLLGIQTQEDNQQDF